MCDSGESDLDVNGDEDYSEDEVDNEEFYSEEDEELDSEVECSEDNSTAKRSTARMMKNSTAKRTAARTEHCVLSKIAWSQNGHVMCANPVHLECLRMQRLMNNSAMPPPSRRGPKRRKDIYL
jgi:hypothetical protein